MRAFSSFFAVALLATAAPSFAEEPAAAVAPSAPADPIAALGLGPVTAQARVGNTLYLALQSGGVAVVDVTDPAATGLITRIADGRAVSRLLVDGDRLYLIVLREDVEAYSLADPRLPTLALPLSAPGASTGTVVVEVPARAAPVPAPAAPAAPAKAKPMAKVKAVVNGRALFDAGLDAGFEKGQRVRIISQRLVEKPALDGTGVRQVPSGEVTAVVAIEEIETTGAMARLGRGDVAMPGDLVEVTSDELSERLFLPRRAPFSIRAGFHARPFLGLSSNGTYPVGVLLDGYASYTFDNIPLSLSAEVAPAGFAVLTAEPHYPITLVGGASYVTDFFEVGLGAGGLIGNRGPCFREQEFDPITGEPIPSNAPAVCEENTGFTFNQMLRLGAIDGISLTWRSSIFARPEGFVFGMGRAEANVPVTSRLGLFAAGGGGENGWGFGEVGVRSLFGGTGAPGTLILSTSLGGVAIFDGPSRELVGGPSVAIGMEWRL